jgi:hypothetical protein
MVEDQFGPRVYKVTKPRRFCAPADLAGASPAAPTHATYLVCYQLAVASTKPKQAKFVATQVSTHPVFGAEALNVTKPDEICVPSFRDPASATPVPTATATPAPSGNVVAIRISPKTRYVTPGGTATFTATADARGRRHRELHAEGDLELATRPWRSRQTRPTTGAASPPSAPACPPSR